MLYSILLLLIFLIIIITTTLSKSISPLKMWYNNINIIDSATHIWGDGKEPYPYINPVPDNLSHCNANYLIEKILSFGKGNIYFIFLKLNFFIFFFIVSEKCQINKRR